MQQECDVPLFACCSGLVGRKWDEGCHQWVTELLLGGQHPSTGGFFQKGGRGFAHEDPTSSPCHEGVETLGNRGLVHAQQSHVVHPPGAGGEANQGTEQGMLARTRPPVVKSPAPITFWRAENHFGQLNNLMQMFTPEAKEKRQFAVRERLGLCYAPHIQMNTPRLVPAFLQCFLDFVFVQALQGGDIYDFPKEVDVAFSYFAYNA